MKILLTSSDNFPLSEIQQHFGVVDSQIVIGANIFRDVFANFRDVFGGETKGYKKDLNKLKKAAFEEIKKQAMKFGANAVISLRLDLDEVSGGGKSMFMLNAYGSAVSLKETVFKREEKRNAINKISVDDIMYFKKRNKLIKKISESFTLSEEINSETISEFDLWDHNIALTILLKESNRASESLQYNISEIPIEFIEKFLSSNIDKIDRFYWNSIYKTFKEKNRFNPTFLFTLLKSPDYIQRFRGLKLCLIKKQSYTQTDTEELKSIGDYLLSDFDSSIKSREVSKVIGSKKVFTCPYCLSDSRSFYKQCECGRNKYGFIESGNDPKSIGKYLIQMAEAVESAFDRYNK